MNPIDRAGDSARCADHVVHAGVGYFVEVPPDPAADFETQVRQTLASLDAEMAAAGTDRSRLLLVTIYLGDIEQLGRFNAIWDAWLDGAAPPVRAAVQIARLADPGYGLELVVQAAVD